MNYSSSLVEIARTLYDQHEDLFKKYPGRWTLTTDLHLIPEKLDFDNDTHAFGFYNTVEPLFHVLVKGLDLMKDYLGPDAFYDKVLELNSQNIKKFQATKRGHDLRCILGRNFLQ